MATARSQKILWTVLALALIGIGIYSLNDWMRSQEIRTPSRILPVLGTVPEFSLTNWDKKTIGSKDLAGSFYVVDLIFTQCAGTCPILTAQMASLQHSLIKTTNVKLVSISVDPNNDTPEVLAEYAKHYNADTKSWYFLTGDIPTIYHIAKDGFKLTLDSVGGDFKNPIVHSERLVLVDRKGNIRGFYNGAEDDSKSKVLADIGDLLREENISTDKK